MIQIINGLFNRLYGKPQVSVRSPGRINLIGEHTDYNEGFVLPAAIDKEIVFSLSKNSSDIIKIFSYDFNESIEVSLHDIKKNEKKWANYLLGVVDEMIKAGFTIKGFNCVFGGDIPMGAGLSSSAAIECGLAFALNELFDLKIIKLDLVKIAKNAENNFIGVECGIMDQFINIYGKANKLLRLDCRNLHYDYIPINLSNYDIILCETNVKHSLESGEYNSRKRDCEEGVKIIKQYYPEIKTLRDVTFEMLTQSKDKLSPIVYNRCEYVVEEIQRLNIGCKYLMKDDIVSFGRKMFETHSGLRDKYEVSCPELDFLVDITSQLGFVCGARLMGAGFGGCTINLVKRAFVREFMRLVNINFKGAYNYDVTYHYVKISEGTSLISE